MNIIDAIDRILADDIDDDPNDDSFNDARSRLIDARHSAIAVDRERLTDAALAASLCPLHLIDYAICFDDDTDACASIRIIHPNHDT